MHIVFLQSSLWLSGGAQVVVEHANRLAEKGHRVQIVIPKNAIDPEIAALLSPSVPVIHARHPLSRSAGLLDKILITLSMTAAVPRCDVLVATHTPTTLVTLLAGRLLRKGLPVWFYQDYPVMFEGRPVEAWLLRHALRWHAGAMTISESTTRELLSFTPGQVVNVGDAINNYERLRSQPRLPRGGGKTRIMYLGDFRPRKGLADFLEAMRLVYAAHPQIELLLVLKEDGPLETSVPHTRVIRPSDEELVHCYAGSDIFVSASWSEGFGLPPLEAMAAGLPVALTDSGGVNDYARPGENCLLSPPRRPDLLAQSVQSLLDQPELAARLSQNGPPTAAQFTWPRVAERMEQALLRFSRS